MSLIRALVVAVVVFALALSPVLGRRFSPIDLDAVAFAAPEESSAAAPMLGDDDDDDDDDD